MNNSHIKTIRPQSGSEAFGEFTKAIEGGQLRVVVFIIEEAAEIEDENLSATIENFPVPVVLALKNQASEKLVAACHLVAAAQSAQRGLYSALDAL